MKKLLIISIVFVLACADFACNNSKLINVETGLDVLVRNKFDILMNKRVGVITNHTSLTKDGRNIVDLLHEAKKVKLAAIFGPEHGVRGMEPGGLSVHSTIDSITGVSVYSLYGNTKQPTKEMLEKIDVLVFDIQDIGARFYTYISTMSLAMETAALYKKKFVVLDRPNPISGDKVAGPMLQDGFESFVGMYKMPVRHGLTVGELSLLFKGEDWIEGADSLELEVVKMTGWQRKIWYDQSNIPWVAPSPSMKTLATATVYPGTCFIEGTNVSEGRGTEKPFEKIGAPWINAQELAKQLNSLGMKGVVFEPIGFTPTAQLPSVPQPKFKDTVCGGVFLKITEREIFEPVKSGVSIIGTIKKLNPDKFAWRRTIDRLYGSDRLRKEIDEGLPPVDIVKGYEETIMKFMSMRGKYLLYN